MQKCNFLATYPEVELLKPETAEKGETLSANGTVLTTSGKKVVYIVRNKKSGQEARVITLDAAAAKKVGIDEKRDEVHDTVNEKTTRGQGNGTTSGKKSATEKAAAAVGNIAAAVADLNLSEKDAAAAAAAFDKVTAILTAAAEKEKAAAAAAAKTAAAIAALVAVGFSEEEAAATVARQGK